MPPSIIRPRGRRASTPSLATPEFNEASMTIIGTCDCCDAQHTTLRRVVACGIETSACMACLHESDPDELREEIARLLPKVECTADWAHICLLEKMMFEHGQFGAGA